MTISFQIQVPKYTKHACLISNLGFFFFCGKILEMGKFQAADIKYDSVFKFLAQKNLNEVLSVKNDQ